MAERDPEGKRTRVVHAAATAFASHGFAGTSTAAIARDAGVSEGIVFHYFGSKHGVLEACTAADAVAFAESELANHRNGINYPGLVAATFEWVGANRMVRRLWAEGDDRTVGALRRGWQGGIVPAVASALEAEQREGRCRAGDSSRLARMQFAVMGEAMVVHFNDPMHWPLEDAITDTASLLNALVAA
ncbi:MAG: TetR/AcrR family transcriptional regulator [Acidimicrobiales bacterium]|nr:TetR/AcrR family transcriptional regulator [Acidimicrobiales bacterium]RZV45404.1 MAG: TetR/AcrR family transcriptional regulator [Acidimicrobiales bacterium]